MAQGPYRQSQLCDHHRLGAHLAVAHKLAGVKRMVVSTYQAASGAGVPGMRELEEQLAALGRGEQLPDPRAFAAQLANNLIPQIGGVK